MNQPPKRLVFAGEALGYLLMWVPALPEHFVEPEELATMCVQLRAGAVMGICGIQGEGGTGKSVTAAAVARRIASSFPGGVHWVTVGEHATSEDVRRILGLRVV